MKPQRAAWVRALAIAAGLGALTALGQSPVSQPIFMLLGLTAAIWYFSAARSPKAALFFGWAYGFGYFGVTLHWIVSPFLVDIARHGWMAPFALVLMALGGGAFWAVAFWIARGFSARAWPLILTLPAIEMVRAYIFTGFPWGTLAQGTVDSLAGQSLALWGPYALTLWIVAVAVAVARFGAHPIPRVVLAVGAGVLVWVPPLAPPAPLTDQTWRIVQPNAPQHQKWDPAMIPVFFDRQLALTAAPTTGAQPDAILWSETAIPWRLDRAGPALAEIAFAAGGAPVVLGVQRADGARYFNALVALGPEGEVTQTYDKHHLVPFGEYIPLGDFAARLGITALAPQHGAGFSAGPGARTLDLGSLGRALPLICYEAVFAHDVNAAPMRADYILHATNDAWFGTYAGPQQHLAQARMRAIEQGLPVIRAANTGISAMIDPWGRVRDSLGLGVAGFVDATLPAPRAPTPYSVTGDLPLALLLLAGLVMAAAQRHRTLRGASNSD